MTLLWGNYDNASGNGMRVGIDSIKTTPTGNSTTCVFTYYVYTQNQYSYNDSQTLNYSGVGSGSTNFTNDDGSSPVLRATRTYTYTYSSYGISPGTVTFTATLSGAYNGVTPVGSRIDEIPARPYAIPAPPTSVVSTRNSDSQITVTWVRNETPSTLFTGQSVQMRTFTGSSWGDWVPVAEVYWDTTSYVQTGLSSNHVYQFQVRANNDTGSSAFVAATPTPTTPASPSNVSSGLSSSGAQIVTTWSDNAYVWDTPITWTVQRSVNGGAFANVVTKIAQGTRTWTDPTPGTGTNRYQVAAVEGTLTSAYAQGNNVSSVVAPLAPTLLVPNGVSADFLNTAVVLTWRHNPGADFAPQTHFTIETSINNGSTWQALATNIASSVSSYSVPAGTLVNGTPYLWHVRTEGIVSAGFGPYSASAAITGSSTPVITLSLPLASTTGLPLHVAWAYAQNQGSPQTAWEAILYAADGLTILESRSGTDNSSDIAFATDLISGTVYVVSARARSGAGLWSAWKSATTTLNLLPPANIVLTPTYWPCTGTMVLHVTSETVVPGVTVAVESVAIERQAPGEDWVTLVTGIVPPTDVVDYLPVTNGVNRYRATAISSTPSTHTNDVVSASGTDGGTESPLWVLLAYGDGFGTVLRVRGDIKITDNTDRVKETQYFLGRPKPVVLMSVNTSRNVSISGALHYDETCPTDPDPNNCTFDSTPTEWSDAGVSAELVCFRDYTGRRLFGSLGAVSVSEELWPGSASVSFTVTETDFTELYVNNA